MNIDKVTAAMEGYVKDLGVEPERASMETPPLDAHFAKKHVAWMLLQMPDAAGNPDRFNRWLGFVQGVLWVLGVRTIGQMRDDNR